ncbi:MAG: hypothetical protein Ct9H90mP28_2500 [Paracoccaceae bacterium]|nr:MAG: hypothetical protein Ct9H90mP28_2500 [Paracoccaceae bacterium]
MTSYLHPVLITLTDLNFSKVDVTAPGTMSSALFAIDEFGTLNAPSITIDRVIGQVTYTGTAALGPGPCTMIGSDNDDGFDFSCTEEAGKYPHELTDSSSFTEPDQILLGMVFVKMVQSIFTSSTGNVEDLTAGVDATDVSVRTNGLFFDGDGGAALVNNILDYTNGSAGASTTNNGFNRIVNHSEGSSTAGVTSDAEYDYWNVRTAHSDTDADGNVDAESNTIAFANGDKIYVKYEMNGSFVAGASLDNTSYGDGGLSALQANATALATSPFQNATVQLSFILGWVIQGL